MNPVERFLALRSSLEANVAFMEKLSRYSSTPKLDIHDCALPFVHAGTTHIHFYLGLNEGFHLITREWYNPYLLHKEAYQANRVHAEVYLRNIVDTVESGKRTPRVVGAVCAEINTGERIYPRYFVIAEDLTRGGEVELEPHVRDEPAYDDQGPVYYDFVEPATARDKDYRLWSYTATPLIVKVNSTHPSFKNCL